MSSPTLTYQDCFVLLNSDLCKSAIQSFPFPLPRSMGITLTSRHRLGSKDPPIARIRTNAARSKDKVDNRMI